MGSNVTFISVFLMWLMVFIIMRITSKSLVKKTGKDSDYCAIFYRVTQKSLWIISLSVIIPVLISLYDAGLSEGIMSLYQIPFMIVAFYLLTTYFRLVKSHRDYDK